MFNGVFCMLKTSFKLTSKQSISKLAVYIFAAYAMASHADYKLIVNESFWTDIYPNGGKTFYCQTPFTQHSPILSVSHVYPTAWISKELGCRSERSCLRSNKRYQEILSDRHNMVPIESAYHFTVKGSIFGNLDDVAENNDCNIKKKINILEPPDNIKGDVARIQFYMHQQYNLPLGNSSLFLKTWSKEDPPSQEEIEKNTRIKAIQGNENPFVTDPSLVEQLNF